MINVVSFSNNKKNNIQLQTSKLCLHEDYEYGKASSFMSDQNAIIILKIIYKLNYIHIQITIILKYFYFVVPQLLQVTHMHVLKQGPFLCHFNILLKTCLTKMN